MAQKTTTCLVQEIINIFHALREKRSVQLRYDTFVLQALQKHAEDLTNEQIYQIIDSDKTPDYRVVCAVVQSGVLSISATLDIIALYYYDETLCHLAMDAYPCNDFFLPLLKKAKEVKKTCFRNILRYAKTHHSTVLTDSEFRALDYEHGYTTRTSSEVAADAENFLQTS
jgi:hypothetical protein